jgi:hypothetical protein
MNAGHFPQNLAKVEFKRMHPKAINEYNEETGDI